MIYDSRRRNGFATVLSVVLVFVFGLGIFISVAQAEESYDITNCWSGVTSMLSASKELVVYGYELKGITRSNHENKAFDNDTFQCVGIAKVVAGKATSDSYCKFMDPDGDMVVGGGQKTGAEGTWKFLQGTGKWKGITGGGKNWVITKSKPIKEGTFQGCNRATGTYELPKQ